MLFSPRPGKSSGLYPKGRLRGSDPKQSSTLGTVSSGKQGPRSGIQTPMSPPLNRSLVLTRVRTGLWCSNSPNVNNQTKHDLWTCVDLLAMHCQARSCRQGPDLHVSSSLSHIPTGRHQVYGSGRKTHHDRKSRRHYKKVMQLQQQQEQQQEQQQQQRQQQVVAGHSLRNIFLISRSMS